jgi:hypothetical protein
VNRFERVMGLLADKARARGVDNLPRHLCEVCVETVGVDGGGLWVTDGLARSAPVATVGRFGTVVEELQFTLGEGPRAEADASGGPVLASDLSSPEGTRRWPVLAAEAVGKGVRAVFTFPLRAGAIRVGVLELCRAAPGPLTEEELADALVFADIGFDLLLLDEPGPPEPAKSRWVDLGWRAEVYQATGMVAAQLGLDLGSALARLRAHAFSRGEMISAVARRVVNRRLRFTPETE